MNFTKDSLLKDILAAYPWLQEELLKKDERFKLLMSPLGKMFMKKATVADLGKKAGRSPEELLSELELVIKEHGGE